MLLHELVRIEALVLILNLLRLPPELNPVAHLLPILGIREIFKLGLCARSASETKATVYDVLEERKKPRGNMCLLVFEKTQARSQTIEIHYRITLDICHKVYSLTKNMCITECSSLKHCKLIFHFTERTFQNPAVLLALPLCMSLQVREVTLYR